MVKIHQKSFSNTELATQIMDSFRKKPKRRKTLKIRKRLNKKQTEINLKNLKNYSKKSKVLH